MWKRAIIFTPIAFLFILILFQEASAGVYTGEVVGISRQAISVKGSDGRVVYFAVGWRTRFYPNRSPLIGERVRVSYRYGRRGNVGHSVTILVPSPPPVNIPELTLSGEVSVKVSKANIRSGPGTQYEGIATVREKEVLPLRGQTGSWYFVFVPSHNVTGWIYADLVKVESRAESPPAEAGGSPR